MFGCKIWMGLLGSQMVLDLIVVGSGILEHLQEWLMGGKVWEGRLCLCIPFCVG